MTSKTDAQIDEWLKKLERESWQLELLVSAFTIFLLIGASTEYQSFVTDLRYNFDFSGGLSVIVIFLALVGQSIKALTIFLVAHLLLRGFWIGTIGLRSVQTDIDFEVLKYSRLFTDKLKKKVVTLDRLVTRLDEICSVIFSFAFLVIFMLLALGLWLILLAGFGFLVSVLNDLLPGGQLFIGIFALIMALVLLLSGLVYLLDFLTLGFFKKFKWFSKVYYPFYWLYSYVTLAFLSRSIYYYMISKFSKRKIRWVFGISTVFFVMTILFDYDHFPYYPKREATLFIDLNNYDDRRPEKDRIETASIASEYVNRPYLQVFVRYDPEDYELMVEECPDYTPPTTKGFNSALTVRTDDGNFVINGRDFSDTNIGDMLACQTSLLQFEVSDSVYSNYQAYFYNHPHHMQRGLLVTIDGQHFRQGANTLQVRKKALNDSTDVYEDIAWIPFWYHPD